MNNLKTCLIAVPCFDMMHTRFVASLVSMNRVGASRCSFLSNSLVYDARNMLAAEAIDTGADRILWLDSDMSFDVDLMQRLSADMDTGLDFVTGIYFKRKLPTSPCFYKSAEIESASDGVKGRVEAFSDYPKDSLFEVEGAGFGAVMVSTQMVKDVYDTYGYPFAPLPGVLGEDLAFCWRARQLGYKLWADSRIKVKHIGSFAIGEEHYKRQASEDNAS